MGGKKSVSKTYNNNEVTKYIDSKGNRVTYDFNKQTEKLPKIQRHYPQPNHPKTRKYFLIF